MKYIFTILTTILITSCGQIETSSEENKNVDDIQISDLNDEFSSIIYDEIDDSLIKIDISLPEIIKHDTIFIDNELFYIVEGDLLLDEDEYFEYISNKYSPQESNKIVGIKLNGQIVKTPAPNNIRYSIVQHSFANLTEYNNFVRYMNEATADWEKICNVNFVYVSEYDYDLKSSDNPEDLTFVIKKVFTNSKLLAKAFYPFQAKKRRKILISHAFFTTSVNKSGILRHEIGHILGFRHEHIRPDAPKECNRETKENLGETDYLTKYDSMSVMHYYCGGQGSRKLEFTELDIIGVQKHYPFD